MEAARPDLSQAFLNWMAEEAADGLALEVLRLADRGQPLPAPPAGPAAGGDGLGLVRASPFFSLSAEGLDRQAAALDLMARETRAAKETSYRRLVGLHQVEFDAYREAVGSMEAAWRIIVSNGQVLRMTASTIDAFWVYFRNGLYEIWSAGGP